jgi:hypothetical protein
MAFIAFEPDYFAVAHMELLAASAVTPGTRRPRNRPEFLDISVSSQAFSKFALLKMIIKGLCAE